MGEGAYSHEGRTVLDASGSGTAAKGEQGIRVYRRGDNAEMRASSA